MASKRKRNPIICESCYEPEDFDDMVSCGKCFKWTHFCCAGVGPKIKYHDWECVLCKADEMAAIQKDMKNVKMGQNKISKTVAASTAFAEAVEKKVEVLNSDQKEVKAAVSAIEMGQNEIIRMVAASTAFAEAVEKKVEVLNSDQKEVNAAVSAIKKEVNEMKETMKEVQTVEFRESVPPYQLSLLPSKSLDELKDLLCYVQTAAGYLEFKSYISALCGSDLKASIRNILFKIMNKDVQKLLSWSGIRTTKPFFAQEYNRVVDAIGETLNERFKDYKYDVLKSKVSTLLNNANY